MNGDWKEFSTLRKIDRDISTGRFSRKYAASRHFLDRFRVTSSSPANIGKHLKRDSDEESGLISKCLFASRTIWLRSCILIRAKRNTTPAKRKRTSTR